MYQKIFLIIFVFLLISDCSKKEELSNKPPDQNLSYEIYKEGLDAMDNGDFFLLQISFQKQKKFYQ